jgi:hypothetical protein
MAYMMDAPLIAHPHILAVALSSAVTEDVAKLWATADDINSLLAVLFVCHR